MEKATMSFGEKSRALLKAAEQNCGDQTVSGTVTFAGNDIPSFLKKLRQFEEDSRKVRILAK